MGIHSLSLTFLLFTSVGQAVTAPTAFDSLSSSSEPIVEGVYQQVLRNGSMGEVKKVCSDAAKFSLDERLRKLRDRLMAIAPAPQPVEVAIANADALMACKAPESAQAVLNRLVSASGRQSREWLLMSWQAANAALDHSRAALALRRLVDGDLNALDNERLIIGYGEDGSPFVRSGLDLLANHERSIGRVEAAVMVLLAGRTSGALGARRLQLVSRLIEFLDSDHRTNLLESALSQAVSDEAWWLVEEILQLQLKFELAAGGNGARLLSGQDSLRGSIESLKQEKPAQDSALEQPLLASSPERFLEDSL